VLVAAATLYSVVALAPASAASVSIDLCATTGTIALSGGTEVPIWGFVRTDVAQVETTGTTTTDSTAVSDIPSTNRLRAGMLVVGDGIPDGTSVASVDDPSTITLSAAATASAALVDLAFFAPCSDGFAQYPGPVLEVNEGDDVTVHVDSAGLPDPASFELPGMPVDAPSEGTFTFQAGRVGTFEYQSAGDAGRQIAMGLAGALIVRPGTEAAGFGSGSCSDAAGSVYGTAFARECVLVLGAIDPAFNADPMAFDMNDYEATYWLINGTSYPDTPAIAGPAANAELLLRYVNIGYDNTAMSLLGVHETVVARDAHPVPSQFDAATEIVPAGATEDAVVTMPSTAPPTVHGFPLFNRNLHLQNGAAATGPGGMLVFIVP